MVPCENIYCLSYKTSAFDLVLYKSTLTQLSLWKVFLNLLFPNVEIIVGFCEREQLQLKGKVSYETVWHSSETFFHIIIGGSTLLPSTLCLKWQW